MSKSTPVRNVNHSPGVCVRWQENVETLTWPLTPWLLTLGRKDRAADGLSVYCVIYGRAVCPVFSLSESLFHNDQDYFFGLATSK